MTFKNQYFTILFALTILIWTGCGNSSSTEENSTAPVEEQTSDQQASTEEAQPLLNEIQPATDVTDEELDQISSAIIAMQMLEQGSQMKMIMAVQESGMDVQRFSEIMQQKQNPDATVTMSPEEEALFTKAEENLQAVQFEMQEDYEQAIEEGGLTIERYQSIMMAVQTDTSLQRKIDDRLDP